MKNLTLDRWLPENYPIVHHHWLEAKKEHKREQSRLWHKENRSTGKPAGRPKKTL